MFFVDGGNNKVGIGAVPDTTLTVSEARQGNTQDTMLNQAILHIDDTTAWADLHADKPTGGGINFSGVYGDTEGQVIFAGIRGLKENNTDNNYSGALLLGTIANGANMAERMRISSTGNVGIGTSSPSLQQISNATVLNVHNSTANTRSILELSSGTNNDDTHVGSVFFSNSENADGSNMDADGKLISAITVLTETSDSNGGDDSGGHLAIFTKPEAGSLAERMRITSSGNVGIGVTDPDQALEVNGRIHLDRSEYPAFIFTSAASTSWNPYIWYETDSDTLQLGGSSAGVGINITSAGNVGIGTATPIGLVEINSSTTPELVFNDTGGGSDSKVFRLSGGGDKFFFEGRNDANSGDGDAPLLQTFDLTNGNVGFGTASPSEKLQLTETTHGANVSLRFLAENDSGTLKEGNIRFDPDTEGLFLTARSGTNPDLFVKSDGNVGIGESSPKATTHFKMAGNNWEDSLLLEHDSGDTGWNIHPENDSTNGLWFGYNADTTQALTSQNATGVMHLTSAGTVGVGISTPVSDFGFTPLLHLKKDGDIALVLDNATEKFEFCMNNDTDVLRIGAGSLNNILTLDASDGGIGVGTNAPTTVFEIQHTNPYLVLHNTSHEDTDTGREAQLRFSGERSGGETVIHAKIQGSHDGSSDDDKGHMLFYTHDGSSEGIRFKLDGNSRVSLSNNDSGGTGGADSTSGNTIMGYLAGQDIASGGINNTLIGHGAGKNITTSDYNVAIGQDCLKSIVGGGEQNTAVGALAGDALTTGDANVFMGTGAGGATQDVDNATCIGYIAGGADMTSDADGTVAIGYSALNALTSGANNLAIGYNAGKTLTTGAQNLAIGREALENHLTGESNIAIGYLAMGDTDAGTNSQDSDHNTFIGLVSGGGTWANTTSEYNVGVGNYTLDGAMDDANYNTAVGYAAGSAVTEGDDNAFVGKYAGVAVTTGEDNTMIGSDAGKAVTTGGANVCVGMNAGSNFDAEDGNVAIGRSAFSGAVAGADYCVSIGMTSMQGAATQDGTIAIGYNALNVLTSGAENIAIGYSAMDAMTSGGSNIALGYHALGDLNNSGADRNIAIGNYAGDGMGTLASFDNIFIGYAAGGGTWDTSASNYNVAIGNYSMDAAMDGAAQNVCVGYDSGGAITHGDTNTFVGYQAANAVTDGYQNVAVGADVAFANEATAVNQICIGYGATGTANNEAVIGNASIDKVYMAQDATAIVHAGGIKFDASGETLGDYEEGSWTPAFGAVTVSASAQGGAYVRIGKLVHCEGYITVSSIDNTDGSGVQFGLPFNADGDQAILMTLDGNSCSLLTSAGLTAMSGARMGNSSNSVIMTQDNGSDFTYGEGLNSSGTFTFAFSYIA